MLHHITTARVFWFDNADKKADYAVKVNGVDITPYPVKGGKEATFSIAAITGNSRLYLFYRFCFFWSLSLPSVVKTLM